MKNSAKRARAEAVNNKYKDDFKNRLYTNLDIHEEQREESKGRGVDHENKAFPGQNSAKKQKKNTWTTL